VNLSLCGMNLYSSGMNNYMKTMFIFVQISQYNLYYSFM